MTDKITKLESAMYEANGEAERAQKKAREAADAVAAAYAESLGLQVGTVVVVTKHIGRYGSKPREQQHRLRVTEFKYRGYGNPPLALFGRTIRKDGTDGDRHEIYQDWEIEK